jgi:hypothetical protein
MSRSDASIWKYKIPNFWIICGAGLPSVYCSPAQRVFWNKKFSDGRSKLAIDGTLKNFFPYKKNIGACQRLSTSKESISLLFYNRLVILRLFF